MTQQLDLDEIHQQAWKACNVLGIPRDLREDAYQEAWIANAEGKQIMAYLSAWWRRERANSAKTHIFGRPLPRDRAEMREIRKAAESYK